MKDGFSCVLISLQRVSHTVNPFFKRNRFPFVKVFVFDKFLLLMWNWKSILWGFRGIFCLTTLEIAATNPFPLPPFKIQFESEKFPQDIRQMQLKSLTHYIKSSPSALPSKNFSTLSFQKMVWSSHVSKIYLYIKRLKYRLYYNSGIHKSFRLCQRFH